MMNSYEDCLNFRKYLLKSKHARDELSNVYSLRNNIKKSVNNFMNKSNINLSKKVIKKLKSEDKYLYSKIYKRAVISICFMITILTAMLIFIGVSYFSRSFADTVPVKTGQNIVFPNDEEWIEFFFDDNGVLLLAAK